MNILVKAILIFWGTVVIAIVLKGLTSIHVEDFNFLFSKEEPSVISVNDTDIYFPMQEQKGFTIDGVKSCVKDYKSGIYKKGYSYMTNGSCVNGSCELSITFMEKIPKSLSLYIQKNDDCTLKEFAVPSNLQTIGYYVDLQLSNTQKETLGIMGRDSIKLEHANGYSLDNKHKLYFYDNKISEDSILVNDKNSGTVYFSKSKHLQHDKKETTVPSINIPHPENLYTYNCDKNNKCERSANTYIINVDGVDFIPDDTFIIKCMQNSTASPYCKKMIHIGKVETPQFNSDAQRKRYVNDTNKNPDLDTSLKDWEKTRLKKSKEKIMKSLL